MNTKIIDNYYLHEVQNAGYTDVLSITDHALAQRSVNDTGRVVLRRNVSDGSIILKASSGLVNKQATMTTKIQKLMTEYSIDLLNEGVAQPESNNLLFTGPGKKFFEAALRKMTGVVTVPDDYYPVTLENVQDTMKAISKRSIPREFLQNAVDIGQHWRRLRYLWENKLGLDPSKLIITSLYRDENANKATGRGAKASLHLRARALDVAVRGNSLEDRISLLVASSVASKTGYHCIYESHVHTDDVPRSRPLIVTAYDTVKQLVGDAAALENLIKKYLK